MITVLQPRALVAETLITQHATGVTVVTQPAPPALDVTTVGRRGPMGATGAIGPAGDGTFTLVADRPLGGHRLVSTDGAGGLAYADCTAADALTIIGMTMHAATTGDDINLRRVGEIVESSWTWAPGLPVYLGIDGVPTQTLPPEAAFSLVVGIPTAPTKLFMAPREPIHLIEA